MVIIQYKQNRVLYSCISFDKTNKLYIFVGTKLLDMSCIKVDIGLKRSIWEGKVLVDKKKETA